MIKEEMERNLRWTAGICSGGAGLNKPSKGVNFGVPPGLGSDFSGDNESKEMENEVEEYEEEWSESTGFE